MKDIKNWAKDNFPVINNNDISYLDNAATTQKPIKVIEAVSEYSKKFHANIHRGAYSLSVNATIKYDSVRKKVKDFIHASSDEEIVFTKGTTESFNLLAYSYAENITAGDEIVISYSEHHSNILPWQTLCKNKGAILKYLDIDEEGIIDIEKISDTITKKTKLVSVTMISNAMGAIQPVGEIIKAAHEVGAVVALDAAQSAPHMKIDVRELDCEFLAFSAHKMFGPTGVGVLYAKKSMHNRLIPYQTGGDMIEYVELQSYTHAPMPSMLEAGSPNIEGIIGFGAAIDFIEEVGIDEIEKMEKELTAYAVDKMGSIPEVTVHGPKDIDKRGALISFSIKDVHPHDVASILDAGGVCVRAGHHCAQPLMKRLGLISTSRASFSIYNTKEDIDKLCENIRKVRKWLGYGSK